MKSAVEPIASKKGGLGGIGYSIFEKTHNEILNWISDEIEARHVLVF